MKAIATFLIFFCAINLAFGHDWEDIPVPVDPGEGKVWDLHPASDGFNYDSPAASRGSEFNSRWTDSYHNNWKGPGGTVWDPKHVFVLDGFLQIIASRAGTDEVYTGCITSKERVKYPVYVEARARISNSTLASDVWMLSPDDTQEIDILEAYGSSYSSGAGKDQTWFAERVHLSHHMFIRDPLQDYQPTDEELANKDNHTFKVDWIRVYKPVDKGQ